MRKIEFCSINRTGKTDPCKSAEAIITDDKAKWVFSCDGPVTVASNFGFFQLLSPGDSISINMQQNDLLFSGKGAEKAAIWYQINEIEKKLAKPTNDSFKIDSLSIYFEWNKYVDNLLALQISLLDTKKDNIEKEDYEYLKSIIVESAEHHRINAFMALINFKSKDSSSNLDASNLSSIWDSTQLNHWSSWLCSLPAYHGPMHTLYLLNKGKVFRKFGFDLANDSIRLKETRTYLYYKTAKNEYIGLTRERLMVYILDEQTIKEMGLDDPMTQLILRDYYSIPGFPEYKAQIRDLENHTN